VLLARAPADDIVTLRQEPGVELHPVEQYRPPEQKNGHSENDPTEKLVQAVVAPRSELIGQTISEIDFRRRYGAVVVALWRRDSQPREEMAHLALREGDVLVLQGEDDDLERVSADRAFLMMMPFQGEARSRSKAPIAGVIMLATILAAAFNVLSIEIAAMAGAVAMVLARCITTNQAYRAIDTRVFVFIAGAIPLGEAMSKTGTAELLGRWLESFLSGMNEVLLLMVLFWVVAVLTQFMSDSATTAIFGPVAAALAVALGRSPEAYVVTVAMASVVAFLTPIGHHGNLLIYGPGRYQFRDFVKVGTPLTVLASLVVAFMAPMIWRS